MVRPCRYGLEQYSSCCFSASAGRMAITEETFNNNNESRQQALKPSNSNYREVVIFWRGLSRQNGRGGNGNSVFKVSYLIFFLLSVFLVQFRQIFLRMSRDQDGVSLAYMATLKLVFKNKKIQNLLSVQVENWFSHVIFQI